MEKVTERCDGKGNLERYIDVDQTEAVPCSGCVECKPEPDEAEVLDALRGLCLKYDTRLASSGVTAEAADKTVQFVVLDGILKHLRFMLDVMARMDDAGKLNRWLGFVQGCLWSCGEFSIDELREHVREALR